MQTRGIRESGGSGPGPETGFNRKILQAVIAVAVLLLGYNVIKGWTTTDEDRIRALLERMADEVEDRRPLKVTSHLTADFVADPGGWSRETTRTVLFGYFRRVQGQISVAFRDVQIVVNGEEASASFRAGFAEGGELSAGLRPDRSYTFQCSLVKQDGEWMVRRVVSERADW